MFRTPLAAAAAVLLVAPALAQTEPQWIEVEDESLMVEAYGITVDDLEDMDIIGASGEEIGEVEEVLMTPDGQITAVSAEVGGFLGIGDKEVVVELDQLTHDGDQLRMDMTEEEVEALPAWDD
jgi:sporulation protein YlmC with PRC-barrel domain